MLTLVLLALLPPFVGFLIPILFMHRQPRTAQAVALTCAAVSCAATLGLALHDPTSTQQINTVYLVSGNFQLNFGFLIDPVSRLMGVIVSVIALCVQIYSLGYMAEDPGKTRYFALLGFFTWSMLSFVYALDLMQVFVFWELVGLASFFLIGFWFEKPAAAAAAKKAMMMTRVGDIGFFIGMALLLWQTNTFNIVTLLNSGAIAAIPPERLTLITLLIFMGIMGKSAQFPLHTWLPSAMEGPTPVSALLHSATMVAAGVYLFIRLHPLMAASATTMTVILAIATFTMLLASTIAMVEPDIKRVLAYSSISQLSFMLMGLASGGLFAGTFHLTTHAFFKALLFLCAGAYIHHAHSNEMVAIGRAGGRRQKGVTLGLIAGGLALAGLPPFSGFFSKESILTSLHHDARMLCLIGGLAGAFLTAYYTLRMIFLVTRPDTIAPANAAHGHGHDAHHGTAPSMLSPILFLALVTLVLGFFAEPLAHWLGLEEGHPGLGLMAAALFCALSGVVIAWLDYGRAGARRVGFISAIPPLHRLFANAWFVDAFYAATITRLVDATSRVCEIFEVKGVDGATDGLGDQVARAGGQVARAQTGWLQAYVASSVIVITLLLLYLGLQ